MARSYIIVFLAALAVGSIAVRYKKLLTVTPEVSAVAIRTEHPILINPQPTITFIFSGDSRTLGLTTTATWPSDGLHPCQTCAPVQFATAGTATVTAMTTK